MIIENYAAHKKMSVSDFIRYGCQLAINEVDDELDKEELKNG
jgi:hypothetical protein